LKTQRDQRLSKARINIDDSTTKHILACRGKPTVHRPASSGETDPSLFQSVSVYLARIQLWFEASKWVGVRSIDSRDDIHGAAHKGEGTRRRVSHDPRPTFQKLVRFVSLISRANMIDLISFSCSSRRHREALPDASSKAVVSSWRWWWWWWWWRSEEAELVSETKEAHPRNSVCKAGLVVLPFTCWPFLPACFSHLPYLRGPGQHRPRLHS